MYHDFKVGDSVINMTDMYSMTNRQVLCKVVAVTQHEIKVAPTAILMDRNSYNEYSYANGKKSWREVMAVIEKGILCFWVHKENFVPFTEKIHEIEVC